MRNDSGLEDVSAAQRPRNRNRPRRVGWITLSQPMDNDMSESLNRRQILQRGLIVGLPLILGACQRKMSGKWKPLSPDELDSPPMKPLAGGDHPRPHPQYEHEQSPISGIVPRRDWTDA